MPGELCSRRRLADLSDRPFRLSSGLGAKPGLFELLIWHDVELPLGPAFGGPLAFAQASFCGIDPRGLVDDYADYWRTPITRKSISNIASGSPTITKAMGSAAGDLRRVLDPDGYAVHAPDQDNGVIAPTAALSSFPYAPEAAQRALRHFHEDFGERLWGRFGFADAFCEDLDWVAPGYLAIDQGPIVAMIENDRSGLIVAAVHAGRGCPYSSCRLGFRSPHLK